MTRAETALLLAQCAAFDRRTIGDADVIAWHAALNDVAYEDAQTAVVEHYRDSLDYLMPAHVRATVRRMRTARLADGVEPVPVADPDDVVAYQRALREQRSRRASARSSGLALGSGGVS